MEVEQAKELEALRGEIEALRSEMHHLAGL